MIKNENLLGLIAVPINSMMSVTGNCSYKIDDVENYVLPNGVCRLDNDRFVIQKNSKYESYHKNKVKTMGYKDDMLTFKDEKSMAELKPIMSKFENMMQNSDGCYVKPNPSLFPFHVYWKCIGDFSPIVLYFPYLVLTLALLLILLERIFTRYLWTGQRSEKFYDLLVKNVIESGDIDKK